MTTSNWYKQCTHQNNDCTWQLSWHKACETAALRRNYRYELLCSRWKCNLSRDEYTCLGYRLVYIYCTCLCMYESSRWVLQLVVVTYSIHTSSWQCWADCFTFSSSSMTIAILGNKSRGKLIQSVTHMVRRE